MGRAERSARKGGRQPPFCLQAEGGLLRRERSKPAYAAGAGATGLGEAGEVPHSRC